MQIKCKFCHSSFVLNDQKFLVPIHYCPGCGHLLETPEKLKIPLGKQETILESQSSHQHSNPSEITLVQGHAPEDHVQFSIGPYQILKSIGKGGMGEVFLAYDTTCGRRIALKRIRTDLVQYKQM